MAPLLGQGGVGSRQRLPGSFESRYNLQLRARGTHPCWALGPAFPPLLRRGAHFQECRTSLQREGNPKMRNRFASYPLLISPLCASQGGEKLRPLLDKGGLQGGSASPLRP